MEAEKQILLKMEWNNTFSPEYFNDEERIDEANQSEKQAYERQVRVEKELGRKIWSLIGYIAFFAIFSYLVFSHVRVSMFNMYNDALKNNIEGVTVQSGVDNYINITDVSTYEEITSWLSEAMPYIIDTIRTGTDGKDYYFINDYNFVLKNKLRFCFKLTKEETNQNNGGPKPILWQRVNKGIDTESFTGKASGFEYEYISNGFQNSGSHCRTFDIETLFDDMVLFVSDEIVGDRMLFISLEFVTYEASNYFYTYSAIKSTVLNNGDIETTLDIASLDIRKYNEWYDWLRMIFELAFIFAIFGMIYTFVKRKIHILSLYRKWEFMEINHLSQVEKEQRWKYQPEIFRKMWSLVDFFTIFEFLFYLFSIIIFIMWLVFIVEYQKLTKDYSDSSLNNMYNDFYNGKELFDTYKIMLSIASICISFNLLSYFFMLNHCLADSKMEIIYFLLFYIILILGFVSVAHLTFGPYIKEYHTFGDAMVE